MARSAPNNVTELSNDVSTQMAILRDDIASLTSTVADFTKAQGAQLKETATDTANEVAQQGVEAAQAAKVKAKAGYETAESAVRANPAAAVSIAAGVGFLVGMLATRR